MRKHEGESVVRFPNTVRRQSCSSETEEFVVYINRSVYANGLLRNRYCACTDCTTAVPGDPEQDLSADALDGVTATCPICAEPGCGAELVNATGHRFCPQYFSKNSYCGIKKGPDGEEQCNRIVAGNTAADVEKFTRRRIISSRANLACEAHADFERVQREAFLSGSRKLPYSGQDCRALRSSSFERFKKERASR